MKNRKTFVRLFALQLLFNCVLLLSLFLLFVFCERYSDFLFTAACIIASMLVLNIIIYSGYIDNLLAHDPKELIILENNSEMFGASYPFCVGRFGITGKFVTLAYCKTEEQAIETQTTMQKEYNII